jgi:hypothetical protein
MCGQVPLGGSAVMPPKHTNPKEHLDTECAAAS